MHTILVPTDFSPNANKALNYAAEISNLSGAAIIIMHVTDLTHTSINENVILPEYDDTEIIELANQKLDILIAASKEITKSNIEKQLYNGFIPDAILQAAKENNAEIIIMGTLGDSGIREKILGSITAKLISTSTISILAIPLLYDWNPAQHILLAIKKSELYKETLKPLAWLASVFKLPVNVTIFSQNQDPNSDYINHKKEIESFCIMMNNNFPNVEMVPISIYGNHFEDAIKSGIKKNDITLLVMLTHRRNFLDSIFNKSMTKKMSYHTDIPLLSIPIQ
jgi:nucleotide-binding universal stress UspA family protein